MDETKAAGLEVSAVVVVVEEIAVVVNVELIYDDAPNKMVMEIRLVDLVPIEPV